MKISTGRFNRGHGPRWAHRPDGPHGAHRPRREGQSPAKNKRTGRQNTNHNNSAVHRHLHFVAFTPTLWMPQTGPFHCGAAFPGMPGNPPPAGASAEGGVTTLFRGTEEIPGSPPPGRAGDIAGCGGPPTAPMSAVAWR